MARGASGGACGDVAQVPRAWATPHGPSHAGTRRRGRAPPPARVRYIPLDALLHRCRQSDDRCVRALPPAARILPPAGARQETGVLSLALLGPAGARLWGLGRATPRRRPRARCAWGEPHRPHVHRGLERPLALRGALPLRVCERSRERVARRRSHPARLLHQRACALCPPPTPPPPPSLGAPSTLS